MQLSYTGRLICLALCSAGLLQLALESAAWMAAPYLLRRSAAMNARGAERSLFLVALFARLSPWLVVLCAWVPAYMRGEDNVLQERVGLVPLCGAACVLGWWLLCCLRVLRAWVKTQRCCRMCLEAGTSPAGVPVLLYPGERPLLAVVGLVRSRIILSRWLLAPGRFSAVALDIAFSHEAAHVRQHDNLKLLVLSLLPHTPLATRNRPSLGQHWRLAAEMAADEEGTTGRPEHSILLAEMLVTVARESRKPMPRGSFALLHRAEDLCVRVDRLLQLRRSAAAGSQTARVDSQAVCFVTVGLGTLAALAVLCLKLGHHAAEVLLHVG